MTPSDLMKTCIKCKLSSPFESLRPWNPYKYPSLEALETHQPSSRCSKLSAYNPALTISSSGIQPPCETPARPSSQPRVVLKCSALVSSAQQHRLCQAQSILPLPTKLSHPQSPCRTPAFPVQSIPTSKSSRTPLVVQFVSK